MLSSHSSLASRCLSSGDLNGAFEAVQLCQPPEPFLASQVNFAIAHRELVDNLDSAMGSQTYTKTTTPSVFQSSSTTVTLAVRISKIKKYQNKNFI